MIPECLHEQTQITKKFFQSDDPVIAARYHVCMQCLECGSQVGSNLSKSAIDGEGEVPAFDRDLREQWQQKVNEAYAQERINKQKEWRDRYDSHLKSGKWRFKRQRVLVRDNSKCQARMEGCTGDAIDIHHLTYKHLGDEPLFDLVSVCRNCHDKLHGELEAA